MGASQWPDGKTSMDWYSLAGMMLDFEESTASSFRFTITMEAKKHRPDLLLTCEAVPLGAACTAVAPLVSEKIRASSGGMGTLMGLLTYLLYQVDFQLTTVEPPEKP